MRSKVTSDALPADPFLQIMDALPPHVEVARFPVTGRNPLFVIIGFVLMAGAWWFTIQ